MANQSESTPSNTSNHGGGYVISFQVHKAGEGSISITYIPNPGNNPGSIIVPITSKDNGAWGSGWFTYGQLRIRLDSTQRVFDPNTGGTILKTINKASFILNTADEVPDDVVLLNWSYAWLLSLSKSENPASLLPKGWTYENN